MSFITCAALKFNNFTPASFKGWEFKFLIQGHGQCLRKTCPYKPHRHRLKPITEPLENQTPDSALCLTSEVTSSLNSQKVAKLKAVPHEETAQNFSPNRVLKKITTTLRKIAGLKLQDRY